jgi:hypothetical protein
VSLYDHHNLRLSPDIWAAGEQTLNFRVRSQIDEQLRTRFQDIVGVYLVGPMVTHYYEEESDLDVVLRVPQDNVKPYREEARFVSGFRLDPTKHEVHFYIIPDSIQPESLGHNFGPVYDYTSGSWYGERDTGNFQMLKSGALVRWINWQLFKAKSSLEVFPDYWTILFSAFQELGEEERALIVDALRWRVKGLERKIRDKLRQQSAPVWKKSEEFEEKLIETENEELPKQYLAELPKSIVLQVLHKFRYMDLLDRLSVMHDKLLADAESEWLMSTADTEKPTLSMLERAAARATGSLWTRLDALLNSLMLGEGGYMHAPDTVFSIMERLLKHRFMGTESRRRQVVLKLYEKFYRGKK